MTFDYADFCTYLTCRRTLSKNYAGYLTRRLRDCHDLGVQPDADVDILLAGFRRTTRGNYRAALDYQGDYLDALALEENACALCNEECRYLDDAHACPAVVASAHEDLAHEEA